MTWHLVEYKGRVAITLGWSPLNDEPKESRSLWVHPREKWDQYYYEQFTQVRLIQNNHFFCFSSRTYSESPLNTEGWEHVVETRDVKPPGRGGKTWKWEWHWGRWTKVPL